MDDDIKYEALSYTWGDLRLQDSISLNRNITSVTVNLFGALEDIRLDHGTRLLWVDALCIDQNNTMERNHQVKQMGTIYKKAKRVLAWLGRPKNLGEVQIAPSILDFLDQYPFKLGLEFSGTPKEKWMELMALCELPYWRRLWIVQEIGLAAEIHLYHGRSYKDWLLFSKIRRSVEHWKYSSDPIFKSARGIAKSITESVPGMLDQQRERRLAQEIGMEDGLDQQRRRETGQPPWLGKIHATIQHLVSRAETAAKAAKLLSDASSFQQPSHGSGLHEQVDSLTRKSQITTLDFANLIEDWDGHLKENKFIFKENLYLFSEGISRFIVDGDFETMDYTSQDSRITIPYFHPLQADFLKAYENFPQHIECVRLPARQAYDDELKSSCDELSKLLCHDKFVRLADLWPSIYDYHAQKPGEWEEKFRRMEFEKMKQKFELQIENLRAKLDKRTLYKKEVKRMERIFLHGPEKLKAKLERKALRRERFEKIEKTSLLGFEELIEKLNKSELEWEKYRDEFEKVERNSRLELEKKEDIEKRALRGERIQQEMKLRCREIESQDPNRNEMNVIDLQPEMMKELEPKVEYLLDRYREVREYLGACRKLDAGLRDFGTNLEQVESEARIQEPAFLLRHLLETCERSLCQDPRDKVYGLLGLASNVKDDDLRVNYSKSMFELFWDVVQYTYKQEDGKSRGNTEETHLELVRFSQLMQRSLGGPFLVDDKFQEHMSDTETFPTRIHLHGFVMGKVSLDSGCHDSESDTYLNQAEMLKQYFRSQSGQRSVVDMVETALEQLQHANKDLSSVADMVETALAELQHVDMGLLRPFTTSHSYGTTDFRDSYHSKEQSRCPARSKSAKNQPVLFVENNGLIGLASCNVRNNDLLVQFSNCDTAAIVRPSAGSYREYILVGRAVVARRFDEQRKTVSESSAELFKYAVPEPSSLLTEKIIRFWIDPVTLQELTCPVSDRREYDFNTTAV